MDTVAGQGSPVRMGLYAFDGEYSLYNLVNDTADLNAVKTGIGTLSDFTGTDPLSTNLNGAVINGIIGLDGRVNKRKTASRRGLLTTGTVIVISDCDD